MPSSSHEEGKVELERGNSEGREGEGNAEGEGLSSIEELRVSNSEGLKLVMVLV